MARRTVTRCIPPGPMLFGLNLCLMLSLFGAGCKKSDEAMMFEEGGTKSSKSAKKGARTKKEMMYGRVVDRNDQAIKGVSIRIAPGNTEIFSNKWGEYEIDSLYGEDGSKLALVPGQDYTINAWKPGFHETTQIFNYDGEVAEIPTITMIEDSIKLEDADAPMSLPNADTVSPGGTGISVENE